MNYNKDNILISEPAPGHYVIQGYSPQTVFVEGVGYVIPTRECYVAPEIPTDALQAIIDDRAARAAATAEPAAEATSDVTPKRGRPKKDAPAADSTDASAEPAEEAQ